MNAKEFGARGEWLARRFLEEKGFVFLRANYAAAHGEIDLIMQENDEIVFVEVKTRTFQSAAQYGSGAEKIDRKKQANILAAARQFLYEEPRMTKGLLPRFDVVELYLDSKDARKVYTRHTLCAFGI